MKLACHCGAVLTHELWRERTLFDLANDAQPAFNVGQYTRSPDWLQRALKLEDFFSSFTLEEYLAWEEENTYFLEGEFFSVPHRVPNNRTIFAFEEEPVELTLEDDNASIETLRYGGDGTLTSVKHQSLPAGIAVPIRNVLPSILPPWPVKEHQKKWKEEHPDEPGPGKEWPEGSPFGGCCNWANLEFQCRCGALLGLLEIDCWQYKTVTFYDHAIKLAV